MTNSPAVEIRRNDDGTLDELIVTGCTVHIEQMSDVYFWMGVEAPDGSYWHFWFGAKNGRSHVEFKCTETVTAAEVKAMENHGFPEPRP